MKAGPGKNFRKGITIMELFDIFPDDKTAEKWFIDRRWPDGLIRCGHCGSDRISKCENVKNKMPYHCKDCRKYFSVKTGTAMEAPKIGYRKWAFAFYLMSTNIKGVASMKLYRELGFTQKTAWFVNHRIRECWKDNSHFLFKGPVEMDETYVGGKESVKHKSKKLNEGRGTVGKSPVVGIKDRETKQVAAEATDDTKKPTIERMIDEYIQKNAKIYTDEAVVYRGLPNHESVKHGADEYVRGEVHTSGIDSFWSMLKRGHKGIYHKMSVKHLDRYVKEFVGRQNQRELDTLDQMKHMAQGMEGKRLKYRTLIS